MVKRKTKVFENKLLYAVLFLISGLLLFAPLYFKVNFETLKPFGILGVAIFNFLASSTILFPAPGIVATGIGGSLYNPFLVAIASSLGSTLGESVGFLFGHSTRKITHPKDHSFMASLYKLIHHKYGSFVIILFAFIPNPLFDAVGIVAGLALYPLRRFLILVFIGRFARDLIVAYVASTF